MASYRTSLVTIKDSRLELTLRHNHPLHHLSASSQRNIYMILTLGIHTFRKFKFWVEIGYRGHGQ